MGKDYCAIPGCHNTSGMIGRYGKLVHLHHLPKHKSLRTAWIRAISRKGNFKPTRYTQVCSDHFPEGEGRTWRHKVPTENLLQRKERPEKHRVTANSNRDEFTFPPEDQELDVQSSGDVEAKCCSFIKLFHGYSKEEQVDEAEDSLSLSASTVDQETQTDPSTSPQMPDIRIEDIQHSDDLVLFYTGLPNYKTFISLFKTLLDAGADKLSTEDFSDFKSCNCGRTRKLRRIDEFLMVMMRLRLGLLVKDLEYRFKIGMSNVSKIFTAWIHFMHECMSSFAFLPKLKVLQQRVPECFADFSDTRVILDCTEIFIQTPSSLECKSLTYSSYKSHNTFKALVGISMTGAVVHLSKLWGGSASDAEITRESGLIDKLEEGDAVMVDKGFIHINSDLTKKNVKLYCPPLKSKKQFSKQEVEITRRIASARIHVERKMEQIKNFRILQGILPLALKNIADEIFFVCSALTNLLPPLI